MIQGYAQSDEGPRIVAIAGPSCSGKTRLAEALAERFAPQGACVFPMDAYYRDGGQRNFDVPDALDGDLLADHLSSLAEGNSVRRPVYDFVNHRRMECTELVEVAPWIFVEGIFALYWPEIRALYDLSIFVRADNNVCLQRRLDRDVAERGRSAVSVRHQFETMVAPMADRYVYPTADKADWIVSGEESMDGLAGQTVDRLHAHFD